MRVGWNATCCAAGLVVMLAATPAHAAGEGAFILFQVTIGSLIVGGLAAAMAWTTARTGSLALLVATGLVAAIPVVLAVWGAVSLAAVAGLSGFMMATPLLAVAIIDVWAFAVARGRVKQRLAQSAAADAWFAEREQPAGGRPLPARSRRDSAMGQRRV